MFKRGTHDARPSRLVMARSRGTVNGLLLMVLGAWGALVPFIGHRFGYGFTPDNTWTWTAARGWLEVLPGAATFLGGAILTASAHRVSATFAGWIAAASGAWFVVGTMVGPFWHAGNIGIASGSGRHVVFEQLGMFAGLGVVIVFLAAVALGRVSVVGVRDVSAAQARLDADSDADGDGDDRDNTESDNAAGPTSTSTSTYPVERSARAVELPDTPMGDTPTTSSSATNFV